MVVVVVVLVVVVRVVVVVVVVGGGGGGGLQADPSNHIHLHSLYLCTYLSIDLSICLSCLLACGAFRAKGYPLNPFELALRLCAWSVGVRRVEDRRCEGQVHSPTCPRLRGMSPPRPPR